MRLLICLIDFELLVVTNFLAVSIIVNILENSYIILKNFIEDMKGLEPPYDISPQMNLLPTAFTLWLHIHKTRLFALQQLLNPFLHAKGKT